MLNINGIELTPEQEADIDGLIATLERLKRLHDLRLANQARQRQIDQLDELLLKLNLQVQP